jgi:serine/threonine-protein kinase RsbW
MASSRIERLCAKITLVGTQDAVTRVVALSEAFADECSCSSHTCAILVLVVEELVTNSFTHDRAHGDRALELSLRHLTAGIEIKLDDNGEAFDPRSDVPRDTRNDAPEGRPIGGLGWPLIKHYCDLLSYRRSDTGEARNELVLLLHHPASPAP